MNTKNIRPGEPVHFYTKDRNGFGIFYKSEDFILFITIFSIVARENDLKIIAFCPMFNHYHSLEIVSDIDLSLSSYKKIENIFVRNYNKEYGRCGRLFKSPVGFASKNIGKKAKSSMIYVFNNAVAGKLCRRPVEYKWNLLAYHNNSHPFSEKIVLNRASRRIRKAVELINYALRMGSYLNYCLQRQIFKGMNLDERIQITDYILYKYNFLYYGGMINYFGSYEKALMVMDVNAGSEYDIKEDYENYSDFRKMLSYLKKTYDIADCHLIENLSSKEKKSFGEFFNCKMGIQWKTIRKFLHILWQAND